MTEAEDREMIVWEALRQCRDELDAYYRQEYGTEHPYHVRKLKDAMEYNPARVALQMLGMSNE